jgi:hypothetical protein
MCINRHLLMKLLLARSIQSKPSRNFSFTERSMQDKEISSSVDQMKGLDDACGVLQ